MMDKVVRPDKQSARLQQRAHVRDCSLEIRVVDDVEQDVEGGDDVEPAVSKRPKVRADIDLVDLSTRVTAAQRPGGDLGKVRAHN